MINLFDYLKSNIILCIASFSICFSCNAYALDTNSIVDNIPGTNKFVLSEGKKQAVLFVDPAEDKGILRAVKDLQSDIQLVTNHKPCIVNDIDDIDYAVIIGSIDNSNLVKSLVDTDKIDIDSIHDKWESFIIQTVDSPLPGIEKGLVIAGSDKRGVIYGIYTISEQIGVSPWHWWADVPPDKSDSLYIKPCKYIYGEPAVKYRGIFLNDEAPALSGWTQEKFGGFNSKFYVHVFELLLRLKANFLWPAMWGRAFNTDDPLNPVLAHEYGIVMSTSHHEPMMRAQADWNSNRSKGYAWDYNKNPEILHQFWREGLEIVKDYDKIITLGMRGDGDEPMSENENVALLEKIVSDQRGIIKDVIEKEITAIPQVWALYKEVQGYYERGMRVPDDVTLLWCDDNWGNIRRLPTVEETKRSGGAGIYYHFDYVGGPRSYRWINTNPIPKIWEQMNLAYNYQANRIWVVNVGDLKPMEFPIEFFLTMAWNPEKWSKESLKDYTRLWAAREFGNEYADDIAQIIEKYTKYNGRCKPELLSPDVYSIVNYREAERVLNEYKVIVEKAECIFNNISKDRRDAFFQLVLHPTKASSVVTEMYIAAGINQIYAEQERCETNKIAEKVKQLFEEDAALSQQYHNINNGKWNHFMDQTHIGYTNWNNPPLNIMPKTRKITVPAKSSLGVAIEGTNQVWQSTPEKLPALPQFDCFARQELYIEVFNKGEQPFEFSAVANKPWIDISKSNGTIKDSVRVWIKLNWDIVPDGKTRGIISIKGAGSEVQVQIDALNPLIPLVDNDFFIESNGYISIEPEHYTKKNSISGCYWDNVEDYGISLSGMTTFPVRIDSFEPGKGPSLEYNIYILNPGEVQLHAYLSPILNFAPDRGISFAVSIDNFEPDIINLTPKGYTAGDANRDWARTVIHNYRHLQNKLNITEPGHHVLKIWMVDPGVVLQKLVIDTGGLQKSRLGPPESPLIIGK